MKRLFSLLLCLFLCFSFTGCQQEETAPLLKPVEFYYLQNTFSFTNSDTILGSELWESADHEDDLVYLIDLYFSGPQSDTLSLPFPKGCTVVSITKKNDTVTITVSDHFAKLTGMDLSVACTCLAKTLTGLSGADTVIIQTRTQLLDGKKSITIRDGVPILSDDYIAPIQSE